MFVIASRVFLLTCAVLSGYLFPVDPVSALLIVATGLAWISHLTLLANRRIAAETGRHVQA